MTAEPGCLTRMLYSCTHMATVVVKGLNIRVFQATSRSGCLMKLSFLRRGDVSRPLDLVPAVRNGVGLHLRVLEMVAMERVRRGMVFAGEKGEAAAVGVAAAARAANGPLGMPGGIVVNQEIKPLRRRRIGKQPTTSRTAWIRLTLTKVL